MKISRVVRNTACLVGTLSFLLRDASYPPAGRFISRWREGSNGTGERALLVTRLTVDPHGDTGTVLLTPRQFFRISKWRQIKRLASVADSHSFFTIERTNIIMLSNWTKIRYSCLTCAAQTSRCGQTDFMAGVHRSVDLVTKTSF